MLKGRSNGEVTGRKAASAGYKIETAEGVFRVRTDEPTARTSAIMHRTP
jgi:hypothetical protein